MLERQESLRLRSKGKKGDDSKTSKKSKKEKKTKSLSSETVDTLSSPSNSSPYDGFAWLLLFLPSLVYYLFLRASSNSAVGGAIQRGIFSHGTSYIKIPTSVHCSFSKCDGVSELFPLSEASASSQLMQSIQEVLSNTEEQPDIFHHLNHPVWVHDEELGRGFLLISDMSTNRIWRWETGGGPIPIGRTLHMERSGCRSQRSQCDAWSKSPMNKIGSAGLVMTSTLPSTTDIEPRLIVSEIGENRIIRIEEDGARTPLIKPVQAWDLLYIPTFHDLLFTSMDPSHSHQLFALRKINSIPPIPSSQSRAMHFMNKTQHEDGTLEVLYDGQSTKSQLMAVALAADYRSVFVLEYTNDSKVLVVNVMLEEVEEDDEDDDEEEEEEENNNDDEASSDDEEEDNNKCRSSIFFDLTQLFPGKPTNLSTAGNGGIQIDTQGNIYVAIHLIGIVIINSSGDHIGTIPVSNPHTPFSQEEIITGLAFGEDDYLYVSTTVRLLRLKLQTNTKGMTMNVIQNSKHTPNKWATRCSSIIP